MKELTIEEKAKRYDEAIKRVEDINKESEDEKIRKTLIHIVKGACNKYGIKYQGKEIGEEKLLVYLEKQGEHANFRNKIQIGDKVTRNKDGVLVNLSQLKRVAKKDEKQSEQRPLGFNIGDKITVNGQICKVVAAEQKPTDKVEPKFKVGDEIKTANKEPLTITKIDEKGYWSEDLFICDFDEECCWDLVENKSAWSEEDEKQARQIERIVHDDGCTQKLQKQIADWLKSLKGRVQPKQDWSQNDIDMIGWLIRCCEKEHEELCNDKYGHQDIVSDLKRDCRKKWDWLESLKNRVAPQKQ